MLIHKKINFPDNADNLKLCVFIITNSQKVTPFLVNWIHSIGVSIREEYRLYIDFDIDTQLRIQLFLTYWLNWNR